MIDADGTRHARTAAQSIERVLNAPDGSAVYNCTRRNLFLGRFMRHSGWYPDRVSRAIRQPTLSL